MPKLYLICLLSVFVVFVSGSLFAQARNMLPRFPEVVIEDGLSEYFIISDCIAKVIVNDDNADTSLSFNISNVTAKDIETSLKFRVLYPKNKNKILIRINKQDIKYQLDNPKYKLNLKTGEAARVDIISNVSVNYSVDNIRKALREDENERKGKNKNSLLRDLSSFFSRERFGKRFMVGSLVSKWGIFPLVFKDLKIEVVLPKGFGLVAQKPEIWTKKTGSNIIFISTALEGFAGSVFLPENDIEDFIKTQQILSSHRFMH